MCSNDRRNGFENLTSDLSGYETPISICIEGSTNEPTLEIHPVCVPPKTNSFQKFKHRFGEVFFPDKPLHRYKNLTFWRKLVLFFESLFPILGWLRFYNFKLFRSDVIAGLTIASLAIPQGISYAKLANLPPIYGLYSSFVPPLIYSVLGTSRHVGIGPISMASLIMGTMLTDRISPINEPDLYLKLALSSTFFAGVFQASLGIFRLGFIIDYLSKATLIGFMAGVAIVVSLQQLKGLLGITHFTGKMQIIPVLTSTFDHEKEWNWKTIVMGISLLVFLLTARVISTRKPKLFWISAAAPLTSVIISTLLVFLLKSKLRDVSIIGKLPDGLNPPSINKLYFHGPHLGLGIKTGLITGILSLTEGIAVGRTFASLEKYRVDGNKEMRAIGLMNMAGSCTSCIITTGTFSRSAVNYNAGGKTAVSNIVMAAAVVVTLLFLMPLFYYTPNVVLAAIIVTAVIGLIDYNAAINFWKIDKLDFLACLCSFFGVIFFSVQIGIAIAVGISVLNILLHITRPNTIALGNIPGTQLYLDLKRYETASRVPSFLILSIESPIYFANSNYLEERILRWVREEEERIQENNEMDLKSIILDMTAVTAIDTSGISTIDGLHNTLHQRSLKLVLVHPAGDVVEKLQSSKVLDMFKSNGLFLSVGEAIADISSSGSLT